MFCLKQRCRILTEIFYFNWYHRIKYPHKFVTLIGFVSIQDGYIFSRLLKAKKKGLEVFE